MNDPIHADVTMTMLRTQWSPTIGALAAALAKAQGVMGGAKKDAINPHFRAKYADLASIWDACREPLSVSGLAVIQLTQPATGGVTVVTILAHASGEWIRSELFMPCAKPDAQGLGSAITYARRYALAAIVGVAPEDDDAEGAVRSRAPELAKTRAAVTEAAPPQPIVVPTAEAEADKLLEISNDLMAHLDAVTSAEENKAFGPMVAKIPEPFRTPVREKYNANVRRFKTQASVRT